MLNITHIMFNLHLVASMNIEVLYLEVHSSSSSYKSNGMKVKVHSQSGVLV